MIKINDIDITKVKVYDPNDVYLGEAVYEQIIDLQVQIARENAIGYYIKYNDIKIHINNYGELSTWPSGMFDYPQKAYATLFKLRKEKNG